MQRIVVWPCCIGYISKAERLAYHVYVFVWYYVIGLANSDLTG
jgi:hypothetical protein